MEDLFKKFINAGVGFVSLTNDRVQSTIDKLVKESKLSEKEGQKIMDDLRKNTDTKRKEMEEQITGIANRLMKGVGLATNADVEELKRSVRGTKTSSATGAATASKSTSSSKSSSTKPASSATAKAAGATKKAANSVSAAAGTAQKSAAAKAGATKPAAKKAAPKSADTNSDGASSAS